MVKTRTSGRASGNNSHRESSHGEAHNNNETGNGPIPENRTTAQVMVGQAQMMRAMIQQMQQQYQQMMQHMMQQQNQQHNGPRLPEFLCVRPPTFSSATNPMEANDWLDSIEQNLNLLQYTDQEKVAFATHQL